MAQKIKFLDFLILILVVLGWGLNNVVVKYLLREMPPFLLLSVRFLIVGSILIFFFRPDQKHLKAIFFVTLFLGIGHFGMWMLGANGVDAAAAAIAAQLSVPFSFILAFFVLGEKINFLQVAGMVVAFWGVAVLSGEPQIGKPLYLFLVVASAFFAAVNNVYLNREKNLKHHNYNYMVLLTSTSLMCVPFFAIFSLAFEANQFQQIIHLSGWGILALVYTVLVNTIFGYVAWMKMVSKYPVGKICYYPLLQPLFAIIFGFWLLGEQLTEAKLIGSACIIAGIVLINHHRVQEKEFALQKIKEPYKKTGC